MHESGGCSVVIVFDLEWRGISYLEKRRGIVGTMFFQERKEQGGQPCPQTDRGHHHGRGGPHGLAVAASPCRAGLVLWVADTTGCPW